jgi:hypothetical protein
MRAAALLAFGLSILGCPDRSDPPDPLSSDAREIDRLRSPDGKVDAVLSVTPTDPLSSDIQSVRLEPVGVKAEWDGIVARATHNPGKLGMRWLSDTLLLITYRGGHIYDFDNLWWTYKLSPKKDEVHFVELRLSKEP